jgi:hypothetical protein
MMTAVVVAPLRPRYPEVLRTAYSAVQRCAYRRPRTATTRPELTVHNLWYCFAIVALLSQISHFTACAATGG